jgi:hypothetical protein
VEFIQFNYKLLSRIALLSTIVSILMMQWFFKDPRLYIAAPLVDIFERYPVPQGNSAGTAGLIIKKKGQNDHFLVTAAHVLYLELSSMDLVSVFDEFDHCAFAQQGDGGSIYFIRRKEGVFPVATSFIGHRTPSRIQVTQQNFVEGLTVQVVVMCVFQRLRALTAQL